MSDVIGQAAADSVQPPEGLGGYALYAWTSVVGSMPAGAVLSSADRLTLEVASRAWARWKTLEEKISDLSAGNGLAGEVSKGKDGRLEASALRKAADSALADFQSVSASLGLQFPSDAAEPLDTDLFGYAPRPATKRGRPPYEPTMKVRNRVCMGLALGWSNDRIASALEISLPTLRRYFKAELKERAAMRDRLEMRRFELAMDAANSGNVAALKEFGRMMERSDMMHLASVARNDEPDQIEAEKPLPKGKKERLSAEAAALLENDPLLRPGLPN